MKLEEFSIPDMAKLDMIWIESIADEKETINNGAVVLFDMKELIILFYIWFYIVHYFFFVGFHGGYSNGSHHTTQS